MHNDSADDKKRKRRIIVRIVIIIIILLLLITSCVAHNYLGRIGSFNKTSNTKIKDDTNEEEINKNGRLYFDVQYEKYLQISLSNKKYKVSFSTRGINPKKYTCTTSNSKIATCVVKDGYIEIKPKKTGKVEIILSTKLNGVRYLATLDVKIVRDSSSSKGKTNTKQVNQSTKQSQSNSTSTSSTNAVNPSKIEVPDNKEITNDDDARLKTLKVGNYQLNPIFDKNIYEYMVNVLYTTTKVNITATPNSKSAKIISGLGNVTLTGDTTIRKITVRSKNGKEQDYIIKINKIAADGSLSSDNQLKILTVTDYNLLPSFSKSLNNYTIEVPYDCKKLDLSYLPNDEKSVVTVIGNDNFKVGNNKVIIRVTAQDGTTNDYVIIVNRLNKTLDNNAKLQSLIIENHPISFDKDTYSYSIDVDSETNKLNITATAESSNADVKIENNKDFKAGTNIVTIKVKAQDNTTSIYNIVVNKAANETNTLSNLGINGYTLSPTFNENVNDYNITVPWNVDSLDVEYTKKDSREKVEIVGNNNLQTGTNVIEVKVTSEKGITNTYKITVEKEENLSDFYINSPTTTYTVGYNSSSDNYKDIIINSNVLQEVKDISSTNGLKLSDDNGSIELVTNGLNLSLVENEDNQYVIRVSYNNSSIGTKNITVTAKRKGNIVDTYNIEFEVRSLFYVTLSANEGFYNEFADKYEFTFYDGEVLDLTKYNKAYKLKNDCTSYKIASYNSKANGTGDTYSLDDVITIHSDLDLYVIYSTEETEEYVSTNRLYLTDVDIFTLEDGTKKFIYPGAKGSYIMEIKNTTDSKITLKNLILEEDNICISPNNCLNMGYIIKHTDDTLSNYQYLLGSESTYEITNNNGTPNSNGTYHSLKDVTLGDIKLKPGETKEISLLWKWVDSSNDTEIGKYVINNNDKYYLTVSYIFEKENNSCQG